MSQDQRQAERVAPAEGRCAFSHEEARFTGALRNVSLLGMKVELPEDVSAASLAPGFRVAFEDFPEPLTAHVLATEGEIVWVDDRKIGIRFLTPLDIPPDAILEFQHESHVPPFRPGEDEEEVREGTARRLPGTPA
ncbi:type IV pilus assembly PilZ [Desulfovibrio sp. X2]|uniref:PilZ domain-containing protein n=1 Tax=Desulfovibrio sp. X2 TaxID=941449 RepID=UPI0003588998|nr:PilZ domain-containing protein [Desulfovibrio sp. X2]EPR42838.1 type IV pilus assembly PilZ [Desulfovibrio sp. X2]